MMRVLQLRHWAGQSRPIWILADKIVALHRGDDDTLVYTDGGHTFEVKDTPEEIFKTLGRLMDE